MKKIFSILLLLFTNYCFSQLDRATLLSNIDANINTNGTQKITGALLNLQLKQIVNSFLNKASDPFVFNIYTGYGLTGGPITGTGTIKADTTKLVTTYYLSTHSATGSGTPNRIPLWLSSTSLTDSYWLQNGNGVLLDQNKSIYDYLGHNSINLHDLSTFAKGITLGYQYPLNHAVVDTIKVGDENAGISLDAGPNKVRVKSILELGILNTQPGQILFEHGTTGSTGIIPNGTAVITHHLPSMAPNNGDVISDSLTDGTDVYWKWITPSGATGTVTNVSSADGNATVATQTTTPVITIVSAPKWLTGRTLSLTGDVTYTSPSFDGSGNVTASATIAALSVTNGKIANSTIDLTAKVTGALPIANGGTGQTTATAGFNALAPSQTSNSGKYLTTDGTNTSWGTVSAGVSSIATTSPITGGTITSTGTIGINNSAADGSTKGAASFTAADFDASSGNISLDYTNGQKATTSVPGFLSATDWTTFNNKQPTVSATAPISITSNVVSMKRASATDSGYVGITTQTFAGDKYFTGKINIGNKANTNQLQTRIGQGTAWADFGSNPTNTDRFDIQINQATPGQTTFALQGGSDFTKLNSTTLASIDIAGVDIVKVNSSETDIISGNVNFGNKSSSSQRLLRIGQGTAWVDIGNAPALTARGAIYFNQTAPDNTNFGLLAESDNIKLNSTSIVALALGGTDVFRVISSGLSTNQKLVVAGTLSATPISNLVIGAGAAGANNGQINLAASTLLTTPLSGDITNSGTHLYYTNSTPTRYQLDQQGISNYAHNITTPTTGGTVSLTNNNYNIINPAGALLALTVNLPSSPVNNDVVYIKFTQSITTVTYGNGTVVDGITAPTAGGLTVLTYDSGTTSWY